MFERVLWDLKLTTNDTHFAKILQAAEISLKNFSFSCYEITISLVKMCLGLRKINICEFFFIKQLQNYRKSLGLLTWWLWAIFRHLRLKQTERLRKCFKWNRNALNEIADNLKNLQIKFFSSKFFLWKLSKKSKMPENNTKFYQSTNFIENSKKVRTWLLWYQFNFKNERNCDIMKLPCLIKAKTGINNRDYINC